MREHCKITVDMIKYIIINTNKERYKEVIKNKTTLKNAIFVVAAILIAYFVRVTSYPPGQTLLISCATMTRYVIHISLLVWWCVSLHRRLINLQVRRVMIAVGLLLAFWLTVRTIKYEFIADPTHPILRYLWYCYYIPMILVPFLGIVAVCFIGKPENYRLPKSIYCLFIAALMLVVAVFTNDLHNLVFRFPKGIELFDSKYTYGFLYYIIMAWFILLALFFVILLIRKSRVPGSKSIQKLPLVIVFCAIGFWICYSIFRFYVDLTAVDCIIIVALLESAIQSGMIPSNTHYNELFSSSTLPIIIIDKDFQPRYVSDGATPINEQILRQSEKETINMGDSILEASPIKNGFVVWQSDVSELNTLKERLDSVCEQLGEENVLLQAELELKERKAKTDEKNRLYDRIAFEVSSQLDRLDILLNKAKENPDESKQLMAKVNVIGSYIKRRGNLVLLGEDCNVIPLKEVEYSLRESMDNLNLCDIHTFLDCKQTNELPLETAIAVYDFFEAVIERVLDDLTAVLVHLSCRGNEVAMRMQVGLADNASENIFSDIHPVNCSFTYQIQEEDVVIDSVFDKGGALQ